jgi:hypothetical protein
VVRRGGDRQSGCNKVLVGDGSVDGEVDLLREGSGLRSVFERRGR